MPFLGRPDQTFHKFKAIAIWRPRNLHEICRWPTLKLENVPSGCLAAYIYPTSPFTILEPQDQDIVEFYVVQERRATDFKAPKLWKGLSGASSTELRM